MTRRCPAAQVPLARPHTYEGLADEAAGEIGRSHQDSGKCVKAGKPEGPSCLCSVVPSSGFRGGGEVQTPSSTPVSTHFTTQVQF